MNPLYSVTYIWHDCFLLQVPGVASFLFDFFVDPDSVADQRPKRGGGEPRFLSQCSPDLPLYVIVSHHHKDHYTPEIFRWQKQHPDIRYVLSKDTARFCRHYLRPESSVKGPKPDPATVSVLSPGESVTSGPVRIEAFDSTDIGNSYAVTLTLPGFDAPLRFFHAGDLNAWLWKACSTMEEIDESLRSYSAILESIAKAYGHFDVAMFPVDPRIGPDFETGAKMFLEKNKVDVFFPMHFTLWENEEERLSYLEAVARFETYASENCGTFILMTGSYSRYAGFKRRLP